MPKSSNNPYYVVEIRETDKKLLKKINKLLPVIKEQFSDGVEYLFENTDKGFKIKKKIVNNTDWDKWEEFTSSLYNALCKELGIPIEEKENLKTTQS
jgi:CRISPR/Cas system-associated protein Cas7 (RAMP superfamily)